jgi:proline dehydrogenase
VAGGLVKALLLRASESGRVRDWLGRSALARRAVSRFMPGEGLDDALAAAAGMAAIGISTLLTLLGEDVNDREQADATTLQYLNALKAISDRSLPAHLSVKPTQLGLGVDNSLLDASLDRLAGAAAKVERLIWIDMEGSATTDATMAAYRRLRERHDNVGLCLQAYLRRTPSDLDSLLPLRPRIRLVKGAYEEPPGIALQSRSEVTSAYTRMALRLLEETGRGHPPPTLATHDVKLLRSILATAQVARDRYEIAMLYGIRSADLRVLVAQGHRSSILISYGSDWAAWYLRRLAERPANLMFGITAAVRR